ncbi:hypothetical protein Q3G72_033567 [Acer saccharum]|nr:hypothetical protein Q3G72_033567 [Acer saccharum]
MAMAKPEKKNTVMFPFMAYGHLNPFVALARQLERRKGYKITIVNTPLNIKKAKIFTASKFQHKLGNDLIYTEAAESWWTFKEKQFLFCLSSDAILLNTIDGLEGAIGAKYFNRKMEGKPVWMIGPACNNSNTVKKDHKNL